MNIDNLMRKIQGMGYIVYLGDPENYYIKGNDKVRIHFDVDTREPYPLRMDSNGYYPISISTLYSLLGG